MFSRSDFISAGDPLSQTGSEDDPPPRATATSLTYRNPKNAEILPESHEAPELNEFWNHWQTYRRFLYTCCLRWLNGNVTDAEDALSLACIRAAQKFTGYRREIRNLKGWLTRLTFNICMDMQRERDRQFAIIRRLSRRLLETQNSLNGIPRHEEEKLLVNEFQLQFQRAVDSLPCRLQLPASLRFFDDKSYHDIARILMISKSNARKRIQQARREIKRFLTPYMSEAEAHRRLLATIDQENVQPCKIPKHPNNYLRHLDDTIKPGRKPYRLITILSGVGDEIQIFLPVGPKPKRIDQRINTLRKYCAKHPRTIKKCLELAELLYVNGDWIEAITLYKNLLSRKSGLFQLWFRLGEMQHILGYNDQAIQSFLKARRITANPASRYHVTGRINMCRKQYNRALRAFEIAIAHEPANTAHRFTAGIAIKRLGHHAAAARVFKQIIEINRHNAAARMLLFESLMMLKKSRKTERKFNQNDLVETG